MIQKLINNLHFNLAQNKAQKLNGWITQITPANAQELWKTIDDGLCNGFGFYKIGKYLVYYERQPHEKLNYIKIGRLKNYLYKVAHYKM